MMTPGARRERISADESSKIEKDPQMAASLKRIEYGCRWASIGLATIACAVWAELGTRFAPRRARREIYLRVARRWGRIFLAGSRCTLEGAANIPRGAAVIFASNHQSAFDIPLFHALMPVSFRWMAKRAFFSWPFIGRALERTGAIPVTPGSISDARGSWREAVEALEEGERLVIFPEGTWGDREGRMLPFQKGLIRIAREAGVPVVPVTITGSNRVNPPRTKEIHPGPIKMIVHPPMGPASWEGVSDEAWLETLRERIASGLQHGAASAPISRS
jgi:1-acyl-sn-glycerol-3-phosphate acyltransferase